MKTKMSSERLRAYCMRMLFEAEKALLRADGFLDLGEPLRTAAPLQQVC
jgi:hypothetical protein